MAWDKTDLVVSASGAARIRRKRLSASTAKSMAGCVARYAAEKLLPREEDPFGAAPLGTAAHAVLERLYQLPPSKRSHAQARLELQEYAKIRVFPDPTDRGWPGVPAGRVDEWKSRVFHHLEGIFLIEDPMTVSVRGTEISLDSVSVAGVPFVGFIDRVDYLPDGGSGPVDYKSGKVKTPGRNGDTHGDQLRLYAEALNQLDGVRPRRASVYYTQFGESRTVSLSATAMADTVERFAQAWVDLNDYVDTQVFPTRPGPLCGWCPLVNSCPAAEEAGRVSRIDGLPTSVELGIPTLRRPARILGASGKSAALVVPSSSPHIFGTDLAPVTQEGLQMSSQLVESKPWEAISSGRLNPNSYSAQASFSLVAAALKALTDAGQVVTPRSIEALAQTFDYIVEAAQEELSGSRSMQDGLHTRLRGALFAVIEMEAPPFLGTSAVWEKWVSNSVRRVLLIAKTAVRLWDLGPGEAPWEVLSVEPAEVQTLQVQPPAAPAAPVAPEPEPTVELQPEPEPERESMVAAIIPVRSNTSEFDFD